MRFAAISLCVASLRVFIVVVYLVISTQSGNFWIHTRIVMVDSGSYSCACALLELCDITSFFSYSKTFD
jgi:hypothetical protein